MRRSHQVAMDAEEEIAGDGVDRALIQRLASLLDQFGRDDGEQQPGGKTHRSSSTIRWIVTEPRSSTAASRGRASVTPWAHALRRPPVPLPDAS